MTFTLLFGGISFEHEISIVTAITVKKLLEKNANLNFIFLDGKREFYLIPADKMKSTTFSKGEYKKEKKLSIGNGGFSYSTMFGTKEIDTGVVVNLVHGGDGEDGKLASMFDFFGIDFIGPRTEACAVSFNKLFTKHYAKDLGINVIDWELLREGESPKTALPVILKPLRLGSSIGIAIVEEDKDLDYGVDTAFEFDDEVLAEPFKKGIKEYNLAGCKIGDEFVFSIIEEPSKEGHLDFDKKYLDFSRSSSVAEADISDDLKVQMQEAFKKIYDPIFKGSIIRCDFFYDDGKLYLNEINPIPGSLANYLFDDFVGIISKVALSLPKKDRIEVSYKYINSIQSAKGKA